MENNYDQKIIHMLEKSDKPMDIEKIRLDVGIGNWNTALAHCLGLLLSKKINGLKTSKSWVFWALSEERKKDVETCENVSPT